MGFLSNVFGGSAAAPIEAAGNLLDKLFTSDEERLSAAEAKERLLQRPGELQVMLNAVEAQHRTIFVAGWRPFIGWVCGFGLGFIFLVNPIIQWWSNKPGPELPTSIILELVLAMLGLGMLRSFDKLKGTSR